MTFHAFRIDRDMRATCPSCRMKNQIAVIISLFGQCSTCTVRLETAARKAADVLAQDDLSLHYRITLATSILTAANVPGRRLPLSRPLPARRLVGVR